MIRFRNLPKIDPISTYARCKSITKKGLKKVIQNNTVKSRKNERRKALEIWSKNRNTCDNANMGSECWNAEWKINKSNQKVQNVEYEWKKQSWNEKGKGMLIVWLSERWLTNTKEHCSERDRAVHRRAYRLNEWIEVDTRNWNEINNAAGQIRRQQWKLKGTKCQNKNKSNLAWRAK